MKLASADSFIDFPYYLALLEHSHFQDQVHSPYLIELLTLGLSSSSFIINLWCELGQAGACVHLVKMNDSELLIWTPIHANFPSLEASLIFLPNRPWGCRYTDPDLYSQKAHAVIEEGKQQTSEHNSVF